MKKQEFDLDAGESLLTVPCPRKIARGMEQRLRKTALKHHNEYRRKIARDLLSELKIPFLRLNKKRKQAYESILKDILKHRGTDEPGTSTDKSQRVCQ